MAKSPHVQVLGWLVGAAVVLLAALGSAARLRARVPPPERSRFGSSPWERGRRRKAWRDG